jgi:hypothetical protein
VDHRPAQILDARLAASLPKRGLVRRAIVLNHHRVVHRQVGRTLTGIADRLSPDSHDIARQFVRMTQGAFWIVHEFRLHTLPGGAEPLAFPGAGGLISKVFTRSSRSRSSASAARRPPPSSIAR